MLLTISIIILFAIPCFIIKAGINRYDRQTEDELKQIEIMKELKKKYDDER